MGVLGTNISCTKHQIINLRNNHPSCNVGWSKNVGCRKEKSILDVGLTEEAAFNHTFTWKTYFHVDISMSCFGAWPH